MELIFKTPTSLSGYLLASPESEITHNQLVLDKRINSYKPEPAIKGWEVLVFKSDEPLLNEEELNLSGPFYYPIVCRRSGQRVLVLSRARQITDYIKNRVFSKVFTPHLFPIRFAIHDLVNDISSKPRHYKLSFVHVRVAAYGNSLRAASFYGDDIGEANLFRENIDLFSCFTCGLRIANQSYELIRLSAEGLVSFHCSNISRFQDIEDVLGLIKNKGYYIYPDSYTPID